MIKLENVSFSYNQGENAEPSIKDISLTIKPGQFIVLCGRSGCGKTTLTRCINGLIPHYYEGNYSGSVCIDGNDIVSQPLAKISRVVGSVFQNPRSQFFNIDTTGELAFGCENLAMPVPEILSRIENANNTFDLSKLMGRNIFELSGGEKQRIACASVYAAGPDVFVLDEPSSNLDVSSVELLRLVLAKLKSNGKTIVVSEHRLYYLMELADRFIYMENGKISAEYSSIELKTMPKEKLAALGLRSPEKNNLSGEPDRQVKTINNGNVKIENMICKYGKQTVLNIPSLSLDCGEIVAVIGHNGAGKSTFAGCFCGITKHKGTVSINNKDTKSKKRVTKSYMVMQDVNHQLFTENVLDELTLNIPEERKPLAKSVLEDMGISEHADTHPLALSGGQKQRVAIAGAVCGGKEFLIYDEPTSGLDYDSMIRTCGLICKAAKEALISFVITHDLEFILNCCTSVIHIHDGSVKDIYPLDSAGIEKVKDYFIVNKEE